MTITTQKSNAENRLATSIKWWRSGQPWVWLTGGAVSISLLSVLGLLLLIGWKGWLYFWPAPLYQWQSTDHSNLVLGKIYQRQWVPMSLDAGINADLYHHDNHSTNAHNGKPNNNDSESDTAPKVTERLVVNIGHHERHNADFITFRANDLPTPTTPATLVEIRRIKHGPLFGTPVAYMIDGTKYNDALSARIKQGIKLVQTEREHANQAENKLKQALGQTVWIQIMSGEVVAIPFASITDLWYPNDMNYREKWVHWFTYAGHFLSESPHHSNTEGGVFPAIFGTVLLVILMSIMVMPLGVLAAVYLYEYAPNSALTRFTRIAVVNLAGVPSIVYGVFGLGFFVYTLGDGIDSLFYADTLPSPTFGTPGLLWSALTLATLTLPVVIVATEEGLSRIPRSLRNGSYALGATQFETLWRIVLPMATPAMMTGLILAVARAAGEVAPLMLVGVVKLAANLPMDDQFPYLHLERKFMHLGFHIYDVGFQSANIEATRPLVFATAFLLITVVVALNITAIAIRQNLREKYRVLAQE